MPPPFGDPSLNGDNHMWETQVTLKASARPKLRTQSFSVGPVNPGEQWSGTVTLAGVW